MPKGVGYGKSHQKRVADHFAKFEGTEKAGASSTLGGSKKKGKKKRKKGKRY